MAISSFSRSGLARVVANGPAKISGSPTGTYTDSGKNYAYFSFTANGSLTVTEDGYATVLVIGGGGGGIRLSTQSPANTGGGGAGMFYLADVFIPADTYTVTIGGGGTGTNTTNSTGGATSEIVSLENCKSGGGGGCYVVTNATSVLHDGQGAGFAGAAVRDPATLRRHNGGGAGGTVFGSTTRDGRSSSITGTSVTYSTGGLGTGNNAGGANTGDGGDGGTSGIGKNGGSGIVIVRVEV